MSHDQLPNDSRAMALALVGPRRSVLELGCGNGEVTAGLAENGCTVTVIDIDSEGVQKASAWATAGIVANLDEVSLASVLGSQRYERILLGDVIEHLYNPLHLLSQLGTHLEDDGVVVASVPNVAHADVRLMLLRGDWQANDSGLLDRTHVHHYTRERLLELFDAADLGVTAVHRTVKGVFETELGVDPAGLPRSVVDFVLTDPEATTYQFVITAVAGRHRATVIPQTPTQTRLEPAVERLLEENTFLRTRVAELSEMIESLRWVEAELRERHSGRRSILRWRRRG